MAQYRVIKSREQYNEYCQMLEQMVFSNSDGKDADDEIDLLTLLIQTWDETQKSLPEIDPVALLRALVAEHQLRPDELADIVGVGTRLIKEILAYKRAITPGIIKALAMQFKISEDAFIRPYNLVQ